MLFWFVLAVPACFVGVLGASLCRAAGLASRMEEHLLEGGRPRCPQH